MTWIRFWLAVLASALPGVAHAYIDPGTGSILVQGLIAALAMVGVFFGRIRNAIRRFFKSRNKRPDGSGEQPSR